MVEPNQRTGFSRKGAEAKKKFHSKATKATKRDFLLCIACDPVAGSGWALVQ
jgi:hypothetical protein